MRVSLLNALPAKKSLGVLLVGAVLLSACGEKAPPQQPPMAVSVIEVQPQDVPISIEAPGQTAGSREVEVRARIGGILLRKLYQEGRPVQKGAPLFELDTQTAKAAADQASATLAVQQAALTQAQQNFKRIAPLFKENAVSRKDYDDAAAALAAAKASVQAAQAQYSSAKINLGYTTVTAPISGVTSSETRSEGSLISPQDMLTKISQLDPMYVNFSFSDSEMMQLRKDEAAGLVRMPAGNQFEVSLFSQDGSEYPLKGQMNFTDSVVSTTTGSIRARATFANPSGVLFPGSFVRVALKGAVRTNAILVPQRAVLSSAQGKSVWVLTEDGSVAPRPITTANDIDKNVVVTSGIKAGDKVVVDNITKLFMLPPKSKVKPTVVTLEQFNANPAPTAPESRKPAAEDTAKPEGKAEEQPAAK